MFQLVSKIDGQTNYMFEASLRHEIKIGELQKQLEQKVNFEKKIEEKFLKAVDYVIIPQIREVPKSG